MPDRVARYAEQRRVFALMLGTMWAIYGIIIALTVPGAIETLAWIPTFMATSQTVGALFIVPGLVAAALAYFADEQRCFEGWSYALLTAGPLLMAILSMISAALGYSDNGWASGFRFFMLAAVTFYMAGLRPSNAELGKGPLTNANG